jgi:hypothetical protein
MDGNTPDQTPSTASAAPNCERPGGPGEPAAPGPRKLYARPRLTEHGRLAEVTLGGSPVDESDRNAKEGFEAVDPRAVLAAAAALPIERWSYKGETVRHLGPMAQDFAAAFGLGPDDRHIFPLDAAGVALAALQGLHDLVRTQGARLERLEREVAALRAEARALRVELAGHQTEPVA